MALVIYKPKTKVKRNYFALSLVDEGFYFNQSFIDRVKKEIKYEDGRDVDKIIGVQIGIDTDVRRLYFFFNKLSETDEEFTHKITSQNRIRTRSLFRDYKWIGEFRKYSAEPIEIKKDKILNKWYCDFSLLKDVSEYKVSEISHIKSDILGCYQLFKDNELVYIGKSDKGGIRSRLAEHIKDKDFDFIKIFTFNSLEEISKFEAKSLKDYQDEHGRLPKYNKQLGNH